MDQDYPQYDVRIVVDGPEDPAWRALEAIPIGSSCVSAAGVSPAVAASRGRPHHKTAGQATCGSRHSRGDGRRAVSSAAAWCRLFPNWTTRYEVVALLDADTIPHRTWLRELVAPLADPRVGAATGNRWYMPAEATWASLVRYLWNAAAIVQMYCYGIPWGGTLALKTRVFRQSDLLDRWGQAFCEDTMLRRVLARQGMRGGVCAVADDG